MLLLLIACAADPSPIQSADIELPAAEQRPAPGCGDGELQAGEDCDEGEANSDLEPDACRLDCTAPRCGDGVADASEGCDDANRWGGDGCAPDCALESGDPEQEPNDGPEEAAALGEGPQLGALPAGDVDCYQLRLERCDSLRATLSPAVEGGSCAADLGLYGPEGQWVAGGGLDEGGCAALEPERAATARHLAPGDYALCLRPLVDGQELPAYSLQVEPIPSSEAPWAPSDDQDGDGQPASCDEDRDGDEVPDAEDNCPDVPNGAAPVTWAPSASGYFHSFLAAGPVTGITSPDTCLPSAEPLNEGQADADLVPALGQAAGDGVWFAHLYEDERVELLTHFGAVSAPREAWLAVYVRAPEAMSATLAIGPDDGANVWWEGELILAINGCQGTTPDQFQAPIELSGGWQRLVIEVHDQGGGFGTYLRLLDSAGAPLTDLELSLDPSGELVSNQEDADGDGIGDLCDGD